MGGTEDEAEKEEVATIPAPPLVPEISLEEESIEGEDLSLLHHIAMR